MKAYLSNLIRQYESARGLPKVDINSDEFIKDFSNWLSERQIIGMDYSCFLRNIGFNFNSIFTAEVGKGEFDSVVKPYDTMIISTAANTFKNIDSSRLIDGLIRIDGNNPILVYRDEDILKSIRSTVVPSSAIQTYMTQNPYLRLHVAGWENLHNSGNNNIIVGVYGSIYDKDKSAQIKKIMSLRDKLTNIHYREEFDTSNDSYFYVVGTNGKLMHLIKEIDYPIARRKEIEESINNTFNGLNNPVKKLQRTR